jgi:SAM-dependent methyltransferase
MDDTDYALGRTNAEYDRLIEQADLLRPLSERLLRAAGIVAGMHVLDVGCGAGDVSFLVSELVGCEGSEGDSRFDSCSATGRSRSAPGTNDPAHGEARVG